MPRVKWAECSAETVSMLSLVGCNTATNAEKVMRRNIIFRINHQFPHPNPPVANAFITKIGSEGQKLMRLPQYRQQHLHRVQGLGE